MCIRDSVGEDLLEGRGEGHREIPEQRQAGDPRPLELAVLHDDREDDGQGDGLSLIHI